MATLGGVGSPIDPHGYPAYDEDGDGLQEGLKLELCFPPPAVNATRAADLCFFDPLDLSLDEQANPDRPIYVNGESFWWLAEAGIELPIGRQCFAGSGR